MQNLYNPNYLQSNNFNQVASQPIKLHRVKSGIIDKLLATKSTNSIYNSSIDISEFYLNKLGYMSKCRYETYHSTALIIDKD